MINKRIPISELRANAKKGIECVFLDKDDRHIFATSEGGGIWKSVSAEGWTTTYTKQGFIDSGFVKQFTHGN